jgi:hypothetical protein
MRTRTRILLGALMAALVLASAVGTASARRLELSNQRIRVTWTGANSLTFEAGGPQVICEVTIEGSFHSRTLSKVSGQLIGYITSAMVKRPCIENEAWVLNGTEEQPGEGIITTLPWHILFVSFRGVLPRIEAIRLSLINAGFLVSIPSLLTRCLYQSTAAQPMLGDITVSATGQATVLNPDPAVPIPLRRGTFGCPREGSLAGTGAIRLQGSTTTLIFVRLVQ